MYVHSEMLDGGRGVRTIAHPLQKTPPIESVFWTAVQILLSHGREDDGRDVQVRRQTGTPSPQTCLSIDRTWGGSTKDTEEEGTDPRVNGRRPPQINFGGDIRFSSSLQV